MKLTRTDLCFCRYICCACSVVVTLHVNHFFSVILWVLNLARIFIRVPLISRFFLQSRNAKLKTLRKISTSKIFVPASSNKVFVQE